MTLILGIDPGLHHTGWGIIDAHHNNLTFVTCGTITTKQQDPLPERLLALHHGLLEVFALYRPETAAIEETFVNKNALSSLKLGHARGALMMTVSLAGLDVKEYAATLIKKTVVGMGRADKDQIQMMVKRILPTADIESADAADALAVAICHASHMTSLSHAGAA